MTDTFLFLSLFSSCLSTQKYFLVETEDANPKHKHQTSRDYNLQNLVSCCWDTPAADRPDEADENNVPGAPILQHIKSKPLYTQPTVILTTFKSSEKTCVDGWRKKKKAGLVWREGGHKLCKPDTDPKAWYCRTLRHSDCTCGQADEIGRCVEDVSKHKRNYGMKQQIWKPPPRTECCRDPVDNHGDSQNSPESSEKTCIAASGEKKKAGEVWRENENCRSGWGPWRCPPVRECACKEGEDCEGWKLEGKIKKKKQQTEKADKDATEKADKDAADNLAEQIRRVGWET